MHTNYAVRVRNAFTTAPARRRSIPLPLEGVHADIRAELCSLPAWTARMQKQTMCSSCKNAHEQATAVKDNNQQRLHQFAMLKEIAHQTYDERCEYENRDASCLETLQMTVKTPFKMQRYRFTPWFRGFTVLCFLGWAHGHTCTRTFA